MSHIQKEQDHAQEAKNEVSDMLESLKVTKRLEQAESCREMAPGAKEQVKVTLRD